MRGRWWADRRADMADSSYPPTPSLILDRTGRFHTVRVEMENPLGAALWGRLRASTTGLGQFNPLYICGRVRTMSARVRFKPHLSVDAVMPHFFPYMSDHMHIIDGDGERKIKINKQREKVVRVGQILRAELTGYARIFPPHILRSI